MKKPEAYSVLLRMVEDRINFETLIRPGLLHPLYGLPDPHSDYKYPEPSVNERYWGKWFREFQEIDTSVERLQQALVYLTHYPGAKPFRSHRLSEAEWIRYHVEVYVQELYILYQRLGRFLRKVDKVAKGASDDAGLAMVRALKQAVKDGFSHAVHIRSGHVHEFRLQDEVLSNLDLALLFSRGPSRKKLPMLRAARQARYAAALNKWRKQMRDKNRDILSACVALFQETTSILVRNEPPGAKSYSRKGG